MLEGFLPEWAEEGIVDDDWSPLSIPLEGTRELSGRLDIEEGIGRVGRGLEEDQSEPICLSSDARRPLELFPAPTEPDTFDPEVGQDISDQVLCPPIDRLTVQDQITRSKEGQ